MVAVQGRIREQIEVSLTIREKGGILSWVSLVARVILQGAILLYPGLLRRRSFFYLQEGEAFRQQAERVRFHGRMPPLGPYPG